MSPSLSKSPKAHPRLQWRAVTPEPAMDEISSNLPSAEVAEEQARHRHWNIRKLAFHFWINAACDHQDIRVTVIVEIAETSSPADVLSFYTESRANRDIHKVTFTLVVIKPRHVSLKVSLYDVQLPIQVVVADPDTHARPALARLR